MNDKLEAKVADRNRLSDLLNYLDRLQRNEDTINNKNRVEVVCAEIDKELGLKNVSEEE